MRAGCGTGAGSKEQVVDDDDGGSPVASALSGDRVGDEVRVRTPRGPEVIEVTAIRYPERRPTRLS